MAPDPSYYWEGGRESSARMINGMKKKKKKTKKDPRNAVTSDTRYSYLVNLVLYKDETFNNRVPKTIGAKKREKTTTTTTRTYNIQIRQKEAVVVVVAVVVAVAVAVAVAVDVGGCTFVLHYSQLA